MPLDFLAIWGIAAGLRIVADSSIVAVLRPAAALALGVALAAFMTARHGGAVFPAFFILARHPASDAVCGPPFNC